MKYYYSPIGLWPFQAEQSALAYFRMTTLADWSPGLGKSHLAMTLIATLLEDDLIDLAIIVAEKNKLVKDEWPASLDTYMSVDWKLYHGTPAKRAKMRDNIPQVWLTSYDIIKRDAAVFPKGKRNPNTRPTPGPLLEALEGKRVLVVYDETSRIANRSSDTYKAHDLFLKTLRPWGARVLALTATSMERDPQSFFNLGRLLTPDTMCTVNEFERHHVAVWDLFRNPTRFKNLTADDCEPGVFPLRDRISPIMLTKRKSDPDVVDSFPKKHELPPTFVELDDEHQKFYDMVKTISDGVSEWEQKQFIGVLRQIAGHPMSLTRSEGKISRAIVDHITPEGLAKMGSAKTDRMVEWCQEVVRDQGAQAVIFTFYAHSVLPLLADALREQDYTFSINHGGLSDVAKAQAQSEFRAGDTQIFLTSDAGAKGINLPEATYLLHYERPPIHSLFVQRSDRIDRIDSNAESVFIYSLVARNTIEEGLYQLSLRRNEWSDKLLGDDQLDNHEFISAKDRKQLLKIGRNS